MTLRSITLMLPSELITQLQHLVTNPDALHQFVIGALEHELQRRQRVSRQQVFWGKVETILFADEDRGDFGEPGRDLGRCVRSLWGSGGCTVSRYLIDTNVLSQPLQPPAPSQRALERLRLHTDEIAIASVTWHEIRYGCLRLPASRRREQIEQYLSRSASHIPDFALGRERRRVALLENEKRLTALGQPPAYADGQIAAKAHTNGLILVTHNVSDFAGFQDLQIEDWFAHGYSAIAYGTSVASRISCSNETQHSL